MVERLKGLNEQTFERKKFVFFSNASEGVDTDYEGWEEAREKVYKILQDRKLSDKVFFEKKEFPKESHWSSFAPGLLAGMKAYFDYQYYDVDRLLAYLDMLKQKYPEALSPDEVNQLGYNFFNVHKTPNALKVLLWANQIFPDDLNLYDSVGEMYQHLDNKKEAMNYYTLFESKLEERKDILDPEEYEYLKNGVLGRIKHLLEMK
jgi:tetratricopeptide (TPR) repeat protein